MFAQVRKSTLYGKAHSAHGPSRKGALCATARMQNALFGEPHTQNALFRDIAHPECAFWSRRGGVAGAECAFPSRRRPGGVGRKPPASLRGTMESGPTGQTCSSNPPPGWRGGCARVRRPRPAGPASRKSAVWAEGLAESAPRARPGHHQAASCGLRGCRELSITSLALSAPPRPPAPLVPRAQGDGR